MHLGGATTVLPPLPVVGAQRVVLVEVALVGLMDHHIQTENMVGQVIIIINGNVIDA